MEKTEQLLQEMEHILKTAKKSMFSGTDIIVNRNQLLELIDRIRQSYPEELKEAQYVIAESENVRKEAIEYGRKVVDEAEQRSQKIIDESEIVKKAQEEADIIKNDAYTLRERVEYDVKINVDQLLQDSETTLRDALMLIRNNREELRGSLVKNEKTPEK